MTYPILFVSLGPGEPDLITLKGLNALRAADCIYCPATQTKQGTSVSRAADIVTALDIPVASLSLFNLPMSKDRALALEAYDEVYAQAIEQQGAGCRIVIVAEGDAGFYSSIQYIYDKFTEASIPVERIAGIPAFIAAGALAGIHIVKQEQQLTVIPGLTTAEELNEKIRAGGVIVIMKLSQSVEEVHRYLATRPAATFHYIENVGTAKEYYTTDTEILLEKTFPYFSLLIIQPQ